MKHMNNIDLETFKQLVRLKEFMNDIIIDNSHYQYRLDDIHKELNELIMDITMNELEKE